MTLMMLVPLASIISMIGGPFLLLQASSLPLRLGQAFWGSLCCGPLRGFGVSQSGPAFMLFSVSDLQLTAE